MSQWSDGPRAFVDDGTARDPRQADVQRRALDALGGILSTDGEMAEPGPDSTARGSAEDDAGWVSVAEAADASGVSTSTIRYWYRHGSIPTQRGDGGRYLVPLEAVMARASRLGDDDSSDEDELDMDAVYWSAECERARKEADDLRVQLAEAQARVIELEGRIAELEAELASLEIIDDEPAPVAAVAADPVAPAPKGGGYRGALRPQDPTGGRGDTYQLALGAGEANEASPDDDGPETEPEVRFVTPLPEPEIAFRPPAAIFEDDVVPAREKRRKK